MPPTDPSAPFLAAVCEARAELLSGDPVPTSVAVERARQVLLTVPRWEPGAGALRAVEEAVAAYAVATEATDATEQALRSLAGLTALDVMFSELEAVGLTC
jgi:hypothetical protein